MAAEVKSSTSAEVWYQGVCCAPSETEEVARKFSRMLQPGDVVAFYGDLGTGKTFFTKALCRALRCHQEATSPTFTIINEYTTGDGMLIYHFDFYRLENEAELQNLGLEEFFYNEFICFIEWADKIEPYLPEHRWEVHLKFSGENPDCREVRILKR